MSSAPELAWSFRAQPWSVEDAVAEPVEWWKTGRIEEAQTAPPALGQRLTIGTRAAWIRLGLAH